MPGLWFTMLLRVMVMTPAKSAQVDAIFLARARARLRQGRERDAFRERWLGRFLSGRHGRGFCWPSMASRPSPAILSALWTTPRRQPRFTTSPISHATFAILPALSGAPAHQYYTGMPRQGRGRAPD